MSKIILHYNLSEKAQRAELAAGRPAQRARTFELDPTPELARIATINVDGSAKIERYATHVEPGHSIAHEADRVLTDQADACLFLTECQTAVDREAFRLKSGRAAREAQRAAMVEANSARILALRADDLWDADGEDRSDAPPLGGECSPEAADHRDALHAERTRRRDAARERPEVEARTWAAQYGESALGYLPLQRAATEGRRVRGEITKLVEARIRTALEVSPGSHGVLLPDYYDKAERDDVPTAEAYTLRDILVADAPALARRAALPNTELEVSDVCRIDVAPRGGVDWRTGVIVTVDHPWLTKMLRFAIVCASEADDLPLTDED